MAKIYHINSSLLFEDASASLEELVRQNEANLQGANLQRADLLGADLQGADLRGANLQEADLREANLLGADLLGADLRGANLQGANLQEAGLREANLLGADLMGADLRGANLLGADLRGANFWRANLRGAELSEDNSWLLQVKQNILYIFSYLPNEVKGLKQKILEGKINGTQYEGECCCLIGSLGSDSIIPKIPYYSKGLHNPGEQLFWQIKIGDTPESNQFSKIALELCNEFLEKGKHE